MADRFASASVLERQQMLEDALAETLDLDSVVYVSSADGERYVCVPERWNQGTYRQYSLWSLACDLERRLS